MSLIEDHFHPLSEAEYFALEDKSETKHEFHDGKILAMSGGTLNHARIIRNWLNALRPRLAGKNCEEFPGDLKISIPAVRSHVYPDISIVCGPLETYGDRKDAIQNPTVVIEVLSDSTEAYDRGDKFIKYQSLPSLKEYVLTSQKDSSVEIYNLSDEGLIVYQRFHHAESTIELKSVGITIPLRDLYLGVE